MLFNSIIFQYLTDISLAESLVTFHNSIVQVEKYMDEERPPTDEEKILRTWTFNSQSRSAFATHANTINIDYTFPMANHFTIDFDPKCLLPSPQDTFTFIDSNETVHTFTSKTHWDTKVDIRSNTFLQFCLQPQSDKTFFLKFTISAHGFPKLTNRVVLSDLLEAITCLVGGHLARVFYSDRLSGGGTESATARLEEVRVSEALLKNENPKPSPFFAHEGEEKLENKNTNGKDQVPSSIYDLNSEFYRILFRGGCSPDRSEGDENVDSNQKLFKFLKKLANFYATIDSENSNSECTEFLKLYDSKSFTSAKTAFIYAKSKAGGIEVSELILQIFACLVWHEPCVRYENVFREGKPLRNEAVAQAFKTAEQTRMFIIEQQHQFKFKREESEKSGSSRTLVEIIRAKVEYLMSFQRLSERLVNYEFNKQDWKSPVVNETFASELY